MNELDTLIQRLEALGPELIALRDGRTLEEASDLTYEVLEPLNMQALAEGVWEAYNARELQVLHECGYAITP